MPEPLASPLSQPTQDVTPEADRRKKPRFGYHAAFYFGLLGLCLLVAYPGVPSKLFGVLCVVISALCVRGIIRTKRGYRKPAVPPVETEPYANLQAAMARLHETEDKEHHT